MTDYEFADIGERLRLIAVNLLGVSLSGLAADTGINRASVFSFVKGTRRISLDAAQSVADLSGVTLDYIYTGKPDGLAPEVAKALGVADPKANGGTVFIPGDLLARIESSARENKRTVGDEVIGLLEEEYPALETLFDFAQVNRMFDYVMNGDPTETGSRLAEVNRYLKNSNNPIQLAFDFESLPDGGEDVFLKMVAPSDRH